MKKNLSKLIFLITNCTLFPNEEILLAKCRKRNGEIIKVYFVLLGAATNEVIQIRK